VTAHEVVVFSNEIPLYPVSERRTGVLGAQVYASVAVCRECRWRGQIWPIAQPAVDEANEHRAETRRGAVGPAKAMLPGGVTGPPPVNGP